VGKIPLIIIAVTSVGVIAWWSLGSSDDAPLVVKSNGASSSSASKTISADMAMENNSFAKAKSKSSSANETLVETQSEQWDESAITQLREARLHGDDRAPPIIRNEAPQETATPEELASPELYSDYETRQEMKLKLAFVEAAHPEMQRIEGQLKAMRDAGLDQAAMREAEEKLIHLKKMTERLQEQNPELTTRPKN
jgi:hypothetical protein